MTTEPLRPVPPPPPPAPVVGSHPNVGAPTPAVAAKESPKEVLLAKAARLRVIAGRISTPNVVDTETHAAELIKIASELEALAKGM